MQYNIRPSRIKGQHFLINEAVLDRIVDYANIDGKVVLEIGCGVGNLTKKLLEKADRVIGVEIDPRLVSILTQEIKSDHFELIHGDILKIDMPEFEKVVANIPYSISTPLTFRILEKEFHDGVLMYQKEYAKRMVADHTDKWYGRLSAVLKAFAHVEILEYVPKTCFYPVPKVDSAIVRIKPVPDIFPAHKDFFFSMVRELFGQRRKKLKNSILHFLRVYGLDMESSTKIAGRVFEIMDIKDKRVEEISVEELVELCDTVYDFLQEKGVR